MYVRIKSKVVEVEYLCVIGIRVLVMHYRIMSKMVEVEYLCVI